MNNPLYFETQGTGPDVVLLHGWGLHGGVWQRVAHALAADFCVHCVDLPGHGHSPSPTPFTLEALGAQLSAAFPLPVHVVGWSLGGLLGMEWARQAPDTVSTLSLVASSPCFIQKPDWPYAQTQAAVQAIGASLDQQFEATLNRFLALQTLGSDSARDTLSALRELLFSHGRPSGLVAALAVLEQADLRAVLPDIACPVHLLYGQRDALTPIGAARWMHGQFPNATLTEFKAASHAPFLSHEAEFIDALRGFLLAH